MALDVGRLRADTPGCEEIAHLDNAGAALAPRPVTDAVLAHLELEQRIGGYRAEDDAAGAIEGTRVAVGRLLGADPLDVALTHSDTASWTKALWGLALGGWFDGGGRLLVDRAAYHSHYLGLLQVRDRFGLTLEVVDATGEGSVDLEDLERRLDRGRGAPVRMVSVTHVGTHRGLVNPVAEVGRRTRAVGVPYFLDACQSAGQLPVDVGEIACDVATGTGRKFLRGPRGTGWLFVRPEWAERMQPPGIEGVSATWLEPDRYELAPRAQRFAEFETSYAARIGLGVAVDYALALGIPALAERIGALAERLRGSLADAGAEVHDGGTVRSGIVTFTVPGHDADAVRHTLVARRINVSVSPATSARLDMEPRGLATVVRASPHAYNIEEELERLVTEVRALTTRAPAR
jgi:selenocysteine lyase/cysteine desulfurase